MPEQQRIEPAQALVVARDIGAAQRNQVGQAPAQREADQAGRPAAPAMAEIEALRGDQWTHVDERAQRPLGDLGRAPEMVDALADGQPVDAGRRSRTHDLQMPGRPAGDEVDLKAGEPGELIEKLRARHSGSAAERRILIIGHQNPERHCFSRAGRTSVIAPRIRPDPFRAVLPTSSPSRPYSTNPAMAISVSLQGSRASESRVPRDRPRRGRLGGRASHVFVSWPAGSRSRHSTTRNF
jgi:hypothetical protein